jgi:hypothetical protein
MPRYFGSSSNRTLGRVYRGPEGRGEQKRSGLSPCWAQPARCRSPRKHFGLRKRLRPVDQPEPARSVNWLDSAGLPASGRGGGPAREGRLSSQSPRGSPAVHASWTTSSLSYPTWCRKPRGTATIGAVFRHGSPGRAAPPRRARRRSGELAPDRATGEVGGVEVHVVGPWPLQDVLRGGTVHPDAPREVPVRVADARRQQEHER